MVRLLPLLLVLAACSSSSDVISEKYRACMIYQTQSIGVSTERAESKCEGFQ